MGGSIAQTGADFEKGIPPLADGGHVQGQFKGQAVVAVRRGDEVFCIAAACTHWNENLAEGIVVGDTIRCPGHHSCFSVKTGEAVAAPALAALQTFQVEKRGDAHVVTGEAKAASARKAVGGPSSVVIIGAGAAGAACADMLKREGYAGKVTMVSAEADLPCDRPNVSKDYLAGAAPEEWLFVRSREAWAALGVELVLGTRVEAIDANARTLKLAGGKSLSYGALLLATGGEPIRLPIPGADLPHVHVLRTVDDARQIIARLPASKTAVVIGGSFIGLEAASSLKARGLDVHVVAPETVPFEKILGAELGAALQAVHEKNGVVFHLGRKPMSIDAGAVTLDDGSKIDAQVVVMGVGVRPSLSLAESARVKIDKGVVVDAQMKTNDQSIWAAGDIARYVDARTKASVRIEHWVVAQRQGQTAARAMLAMGSKLDAVPFFWTTLFGVSLKYVGHAESWDRIDVSGEVGSSSFALAYRKGDQTLAVATVGRDRDSLLAGAAMERGDEAELLKIVGKT